ncbi:MAG: hypothetical protein ABW278_12150 [Steroidobacteraceae bacterium]
MKPYTPLALAALSFGTALVGDSAAVAKTTASAVPGRTIGYVMTHRKWAVYTTPGAKQECPDGLNDGQREQFKILYPDDGTRRTIVDTQLKWEGETWHPSRGAEPYPFQEVQGSTGTGLNLDGRIGPEDLTSPEGEQGIDNQLYRAIGCLSGYNNSLPYVAFYEEDAMRRFTFNALLIEITEVDDLVNDSEVLVTTYRGMDRLFTDATGKFVAGGTQRVDSRWGGEFVHTFKGRIKNGVLEAGPGTFRAPLSIAFNDTGVHEMTDARFRLKLTPQSAEGFVGGYTPVWSWYLQLNNGWATHHLNYGRISAPSLWRSLLHLADANPDASGQNTSISAALDVKFSQVYIIHPGEVRPIRN